jgi:hypothetical protein
MGPVAASPATRKAEGGRKHLNIGRNCTECTIMRIRYFYPLDTRHLPMLVVKGGGIRVPRERDYARFLNPVMRFHRPQQGAHPSGENLS